MGGGGGGEAEAKVVVIMMSLTCVLILAASVHTKMLHKPFLFSPHSSERHMLCRSCHTLTERRVTPWWHATQIRS